MDQNYSIEEILSAINEIQKEKKEKSFKNIREKNEKVDNSDIPKNTLRLIEEAEKVKN